MNVVKDKDAFAEGRNEFIEDGARHTTRCALETIEHAPIKHNSTEPAVEIRIKRAWVVEP